MKKLVVGGKGNRKIKLDLLNRLCRFCWQCDGHVRLACKEDKFFTYCHYSSENEKSFVLKKSLRLTLENRLSPVVYKTAKKGKCKKFIRGGFMLQVPLKQIRKGEKYIKKILN